MPSHKIGGGSFFKKHKLDEDVFSRAKNWTRIVPPKKQKLDENCATQKAKIGRAKIGRNLSGTWRDPTNA